MAVDDEVLYPGGVGGIEQPYECPGESGVGGDNAWSPEAQGSATGATGGLIGYNNTGPSVLPSIAFHVLLETRQIYSKIT